MRQAIDTKELNDDSLWLVNDQSFENIMRGSISGNQNEILIGVQMKSGDQGIIDPVKTWLLKRVATETANR